MTRKLRATHLEALPQPVPLLRTKLHRPPVNDELVSRKRLEEAMDRGLHTPLTLVSAPACALSKTIRRAASLESSHQAASRQV